MRCILLLIPAFLASTLCFSQDTTAKKDEKPSLKIGGALRFNYNLSSWKEDQLERGGDFGYDLFRINVTSQYKGITLNAEYRLYGSAFGGGFLKQGWFGHTLANGA